MLYITIGAYPLWTGNIWYYPLDYTWDEMKGKTWVEILNPLPLNIKIENDSFEIKDLVKDQSTCDFTLNDFDNAFSFTKNMPVSIYDSNFDKIFGGFVDIVEECIIGQSDKYFKQFKISCVDNHYLINKRKVAKAFKDENISVCVRWLIDNILVNEGITIGHIEPTTKTITKACNFLTVSDVLDEFADTCGYTWFIDINKKLYFIPITKYHSPFEIDIVNGHSDYILDGTLKIIDQNSEYRNTQYIRGSQAKTVLQTQTFKGDGTLQTFTVQYPIAEQPTIKVNGVSKTVGISGIDDATLYDWYWTKKSNQFSQSSTGTRLISSDTLQIQYYGLYDMAIKTINFTEIDNLAPIDGSSGIVESVVDDATLTSQTDAIKKANALLDTFAVLGKTITFTTLEPGLEAGQLLHIESNLHLLNHDTLITDVRKYDEDLLFKYDITAIIGPTNDYWIKVFNKIAAAKTQAQTTDITDVIQIFWTFEKTWKSTESPNIWNSCNPGVAVNNVKFPCFDTDDKIKYIQFNTVSRYRRYKIQQMVTDTSIETTVFIPSMDLNDETFTEISLWGGSLATEKIDSGIKVTSHNYQYLKNSMESLMIIFTDNKWS